MVMRSENGAIGMPVMLIVIVTIALIIIFISFGGVAWARSLWADSPVPTKEDTAKELCNLACIKANSAKTCEAWQNDFCNKPYIDTQTCSSLVQINVLECESPIDECGCVFEDEFVS